MPGKRKRKLCSCGRVAGMLPGTGERICRQCWVQKYVVASPVVLDDLLKASSAAQSRR